MSASLTYQETGTVPRDETHIVFAQTMGYVAATAAFFAAGAYLGRDLAYGAGIVAFIAAFGVLIGMRFAARKSQPLAVGLLGLFGVLIGLALAPTLTMFDFQRLRRNADITSAPLLAASIFLDILNVFLFFLTIFSGGEEK